MLQHNGFKQFILSILFCVLGACANHELDHTDLGYKPSEETDQRRRAKIRLELGVNYYQQNQAKTALEEIALALQIDPEYAQAYMMRGLILMDAKQAVSADESFRQALKYSPKDPDVNNAYGWFLCQNAKQNESFTYFNIAADTPFYASPAKPLQNAGICAAAIQDFSKAEQYLLKAFQADPNQPATLYHLGRLYVNKRDYERAAFYSNRLIKNFPNTAETVWLSLRVAHYSQDSAQKNAFAQILRRDFQNSIEWQRYQQGQFQE